MSYVGIIGPFWLEDENGDVATINADRYLSILKRFVRALRRRGHFNNAWFQQDGATPHTARKVLTFLEETFGNQFISLKHEQEWAPHSPDLSPLD